MVLATISLLLVLLYSTAAGISRRSEMTAEAEQNIREHVKLLETINDGIDTIDLEVCMAGIESLISKVFERREVRS